MDKTKEAYVDSFIRSSKADIQRTINEEDRKAFNEVVKGKARELHDLKQLVKILEDEYHELTVEYINKYISDWGLPMPEHLM